ncbi:MAG: DUF6152 family protein [Gammaproteobacteria bacterium]
MKYLFSALLLLALTMTASAHHSRASYDMNTLREPEGELLEIMWRTPPHGGFRMRVTNERQEQEDWTIEG